MTIDSQPLRPSHVRGTRFSTILAWLIVLGLVGLVVYRNVRAGEAQAYEDLLTNERARMFGMIIVQLKSLEEQGGTSSLVGEIDRLIEQMESEANTPEDKVRVAMLSGEVLGTDFARTQLDALSTTSPGEAVEADIRSLFRIYDDGVESLSPEQKERLVSRHGYLGRLSLAHDVPPDQEPRKGLLAEAFWYTLRLSVLGFGLIALIGLSLILFTLACVWFAKGRIRRAYRPDPAASGAFLEGFALYLILYVAIGVLFRYFQLASLQWTWLALLILPVVWGWLSFRGTTSTERFEAFGWHKGQGVLKELAVGVGGYVAGLVVIAVGIALTYFLVLYTNIRPSSPVMQELTGGPWHLVALYAVACIFAPFMEESMFRGAFFHHLRRHWGWAASAPIVSIIFAILHPQGWVAAPALTAIALVLAALREWRGSLLAPMAAHACSNFLVLTLALTLLQ